MGLSHDTALAIYRLLRLRMAGRTKEGCPKVNRGQRKLPGSDRTCSYKSAAPRKLPMLSILEGGGRVHCNHSELFENNAPSYY